MMLLGAILLGAILWVGAYFEGLGVRLSIDG
jgi:hypothetical protein